MHNIEIKRGDSVIITVEPNTNSILNKKVMGENSVSLSFTLPVMVNFKTGDFAVINGETFFIQIMPQVEKVSTYQYNYDVKLYGLEYKLQNAQYLFYDNSNELTQGDFSLTGKADDFINLLIDNVNRVDIGWIKGGIMETDFKTLTFSKEDCLSVLAKVAAAFETEYYFEGQTIHLAKKQIQRPYTFRYGQNKGLYEMTRTQDENSPLITRLYVYGSDKNISADYRGGAMRLLIPSGEHFIESNIHEYGLIENTVIFDDIYPRRTGKVTATDLLNIYKFKDADIDFDVNTYLLPGVSAKITFNTGQLSGYTFEISSFDAPNKDFYILKNKDEKTLDIPNDSFKPVIGDEYVLTDIKLPQAYIDAAEAELLGRANAYMAAYSDPIFKYQITCDPAYFRKNNISLTCGDMIIIDDAELNINRYIRIVGLTQSLTDEFDYKLELSDALTVGTIDRIIAATDSNTNSINGVQQALNANALLSGTYIGIFKIVQGTLVIQNIEAADTTLMKPLFIDDSGKIYKQM